jgi:hypothetical protein
VIVFVSLAGTKKICRPYGRTDDPHLRRRVLRRTCSTQNDSSLSSTDDVFDNSAHEERVN